MSVVEILLDGDTRWREIVRLPGVHPRHNPGTGAHIADVVVHAPVIVHAQERWVSKSSHWVVIWCDWENARPAPTTWQRFKAWLTYPGQRCLPEATARDRWVGAIGRVGQ